MYFAIISLRADLGGGRGAAYGGGSVLLALFLLVISNHTHAFNPFIFKGTNSLALTTDHVSRVCLSCGVLHFHLASSFGV